MLIGLIGKSGSGKDFIAEKIKQLVSDKIDIQIVKYADKLKDIVCIMIGCSREQLEDRDFKEKELGEEWTVYEVEISDYSTPFGYDATNIFLNKEDANRFIEVNKDKYDSVKLSVKKQTPRNILQLIGTNCGRRMIHPNTWVNSTFSNYKENYNWIISDVRFPNESKAITDRGGINIKINRHISKRQPIYWDMFIKTNPTDESENAFLAWLSNGDFGMKNTYKALTHESETSVDVIADYDYVIENNVSEEELIEKIKSIIKW